MSPLDLSQLEVYSDVDELLTGWIREAFAGAIGGVANELPALEELAAQLPFVHVESFGGADVSPAMDVVRVDVDVYVGADRDGNPNRGGAVDLAELLRSAILYRLPGYTSGKATVSNTETFSRPSPRPYDDDTSIRKVSATYQLSVATRG